MPVQYDYRKFYFSFGLRTQIQGNQLIGDCVFCEKDGHFYIDQDTGQFLCHRCGKKGNGFTFIRELFNELRKDIKQPGYYEWLVEDRGLKAETFQFVEIVRGLTGDFWIPMWNQQSKLINLFKRMKLSSGDEVTISSPGPCSIVPWGIEDITPQHKRIFVVEGHWDRLALIETLAHLSPHGDGYKLKGVPNYDNELLKENAVISVPASTFKKNWVPIFQGKEVVIIFDNDEPGRSGQDRLIDLLRDSSTTLISLQKVIWEEGDPNDIRDFLVKKKVSYLELFKTLLRRLHKVSMRKPIEEKRDYSLDKKECYTIQELFSHFEFNEETKVGLHLNDRIRNAIITIAATVISTTTKGGQLGLRVIGTPSSAKSILAECFSQNKEFVYPRDEFTGFISGSMRASNMMARSIDGKCLFIKEADTLLKLPNLAQVEAQIRAGLGDGVIRAEFRNGRGEIEIYSLFTCVLCGTFALKGIDNANLGSRFVDIYVHDKWADSTEIVKSAIRSTFDNITKQLAGDRSSHDDTSRKAIVMKVAPYVNGFIAHKRNMVNSGVRFRPLSQAQEDRLRAYGTLISFSRSRVAKDNRGNVLHHSEPEIPARLADQLTRYAIFIALVLYEGREIRITNEVFNVIDQLIRDTSDGHQFDIMEILYKKPERTAHQLADDLKLSAPQVRNIVGDMQKLGLIKKTAQKVNAGKGRKAHCHELTEKVYDLCKKVFKKGS